MKGRKPASIVAGTSPVIDVPTPPAYLSRDARAEWRRVAPILIDERKTLTVADLATFAAYCVSVGLIAEASRTINKEGLTFASRTGPKKHPAVAVRNDAMTQARLLAGELGLTPVSRSRPSIRDDDASGDISPLDF